MSDVRFENSGIRFKNNNVLLITTKVVEIGMVSREQVAVHERSYHSSEGEALIEVIEKMKARRIDEWLIIGTELKGNQRDGQQAVPKVLRFGARYLEDKD